MESIFNIYDTDKTGCLDSIKFKRMMNLLNVDMNYVHNSDKLNDKTYSYQDIVSFLKTYSEQKDNMISINDARVYFSSKYDDHIVKTIIDELFGQDLFITFDKFKNYFTLTKN